MEWLNGSLTTMSPTDAAELAGLVCLLWATAWVIKKLTQTLFVGDSNEPKHD
jgi:hypothetical protein